MNDEEFKRRMEELDELTDQEQFLQATVNCETLMLELLGLEKSLQSIKIEEYDDQIINAKKEKICENAEQLIPVFKKEAEIALFSGKLREATIAVLGSFNALLKFALSLEATEKENKTFLETIDFKSIAFTIERMKEFYS